jgi:peroxiredoxin Q/BCP
VVIMTDRLAPGDTAPAFTLTDADGHQISLADYAGGKVIVYFYPAAMTPGCTTQAVDFTAAVEDLDSAGLAVVGSSPSSRPPSRWLSRCWPIRTRRP